MCLRIGGTGFGGGTQSWLYREAVEKRGWMSDQQFLAGLTVAQVLPGANPVNVALFVGLELGGGLGAALAVLGLVAPAFCVILALGALYQTLSAYDVTHVLLAGAATAGIGSSFNLGAKAARHIGFNPAAILIAATIFVLIGLLQWPLVPVVLVATPVSILYAVLQERRRPHV